jgi:tetratricopeptide (TPR) repeat protein
MKKADKELKVSRTHFSGDVIEIVELAESQQKKAEDGSTSLEAYKFVSANKYLWENAGFLWENAALLYEKAEKKKDAIDAWDSSAQCYLMCDKLGRAANSFNSKARITRLLEDWLNAAKAYEQVVEMYEERYKNGERVRRSIYSRNLRDTAFCFEQAAFRAFPFQLVYWERAAQYYKKEGNFKKLIALWGHAAGAFRAIRDFKKERICRERIAANRASFWESPMPFKGKRRADSCPETRKMPKLDYTS